MRRRYLTLLLFVAFSQVQIGLNAQSTSIAKVVERTKKSLPNFEPEDVLVVVGTGQSFEVGVVPNSTADTSDLDAFDRVQIFGTKEFPGWTALDASSGNQHPYYDGNPNLHGTSIYIGREFEDRYSESLIPSPIDTLFYISSATGGASSTVHESYSINANYYLDALWRPGLNELVEKGYSPRVIVHKTIFTDGDAQGVIDGFRLWYPAYQNFFGDDVQIIMSSYTNDYEAASLNDGIKQLCARNENLYYLDVTDSETIDKSHPSYNDYKNIFAPGFWDIVERFELWGTPYKEQTEFTQGIIDYTFEAFDNEIQPRGLFFAAQGDFEVREKAGSQMLRATTTLKSYSDADFGKNQALIGIKEYPYTVRSEDSISISFTAYAENNASFGIGFDIKYREKRNRTLIEGWSLLVHEGSSIRAEQIASQTRSLETPYTLPLNTLVRYRFEYVHPILKAFEVNRIDGSETLLARHSHHPAAVFNYESGRPHFIFEGTDTYIDDIDFYINPETNGLPSEEVNSPFSISVPDIFCSGDSIPIFFVGTPPFNGYLIVTTEDAILDTIFFNNNFQNENLLDPDMFSFEYNLTDGLGCNIQDTFFVEFNHESCYVEVSDTLSCSVTESVVQIICSEGFDNSYEIIGPNGFSTNADSFTVFEHGDYHATIIDSGGCEIIKPFTVEFDDSNCGVIIGNVLLDPESDCIASITDTPLDCWIIKANNGTDTYFATSQPDGSYVLPVPPGNYSVEVIVPNPIFDVCDRFQLVKVADNNDIANAHFLVTNLFDCPLMEVSISSFRSKRCFEDNLHLEYCNNGSIRAEDVYIELVVDDFIEIKSANFPFTMNNGTLVFEIGTVEPFDCGIIDIDYIISCDAPLGQTLCANSKIYPNEPCTPTSENWSGASLIIAAECSGDSINFSIKNVGTGDMTNEREYIVIEDAAIVRVSNPFILGVGEEKTGSIPVSGSTVRIELEQEEYHPGKSMPSITIERCGFGNFSSGFVTQLPQDDTDSFVDIQCEETRDNFDSNDKLTEPKGYDSEHFIQPNINLEYTIRFQNTGNDTTFKLEIIDTLSHLLDVASINPGLSSHNYRFEVFETGILRFTFNNILLVDSFTNEPNSNGFVKYSIAQKPDVPLGSVIYNAADIYFDFNTPIYTNQTFHTVGRDFITVKTQEIFVPGATVNVYPNPFNDKTTFEVKNAGQGQKTLRLLDVSGKVIYSQTAHNEHFTLERKKLTRGFYFYEISDDWTKIATGKLIIE